MLAFGPITVLEITEVANAVAGVKLRQAIQYAFGRWRPFHILTVADRVGVSFGLAGYDVRAIVVTLGEVGVAVGVHCDRCLLFDDGPKVDILWIYPNVQP